MNTSEKLSHPLVEPNRRVFLRDAEYVMHIFVEDQPPIRLGIIHRCQSNHGTVSPWKIIPLEKLVLRDRRSAVGAEVLGAPEIINGDVHPRPLRKSKSFETNGAQQLQALQKIARLTLIV